MCIWCPVHTIFIFLIINFLYTIIKYINETRGILIIWIQKKHEWQACLWLILIIGWKPTTRLWESLPPLLWMPWELNNKVSTVDSFHGDGIECRVGWTRASWWCVDEGVEQASLGDLQSSQIVNYRRMVWEHHTHSFGPVCVTKRLKGSCSFTSSFTSFYCLCCVEEFKAMHELVVY